MLRQHFSELGVVCSAVVGVNEKRRDRTNLSFTKQITLDWMKTTMSDRMDVIVDVTPGDEYETVHMRAGTRAGACVHARACLRARACVCVCVRVCVCVCLCVRAV